MSADRLIVKDTWLIPESHASRKIGCSTDKAKDFNDYAHIICTVNGRHRDNASAARRLAACWNAFEGMPTEAPEELTGIGGVQGLTNDLGEAMDKLSTARALLTEIQAENNNFIAEHGVEHLPEHPLLARIRAFLAGEAV